MTTTLVTGADRGLGAALSRACARRGDEVFAACVGDGVALADARVQVLTGIDVTDDAATARLATELSQVRLDYVISNAGINLFSGGPADADTDAIGAEFNVNVLGGIRIVRTVLPLLSPNARLGFITTGRGAAQRDPVPAFGMNYGYRITKGALNVYVALLAQDLAADGHVVALLHPGAINTDLMRRAAASGGSSIDPATLPSPDEVAPALLHVLETLTSERSGTWVGVDGREV